MKLDSCQQDPFAKPKAGRRRRARWPTHFKRAIRAPFNYSSRSRVTRSLHGRDISHYHKSSVSIWLFPRYSAQVSILTGMKNVELYKTFFNQSVTFGVTLWSRGCRKRSSIATKSVSHAGRMTSIVSRHTLLVGGFVKLSFWYPWYRQKFTPMYRGNNKKYNGDVYSYSCHHVVNAQLDFNCNSGTKLALDTDY
eukprot:6198821-Pleurochrysis_carterae.AAC.2